MLIIVLMFFLSMQPTKVKEFIDRALAASSHDLPGVLEGFKWVYEKVRISGPAYNIQVSSFVP